MSAQLIFGGLILAVILTVNWIFFLDGHRGSMSNRWLDGDGNADWDAHADEAFVREESFEALGECTFDHAWDDVDGAIEHRLSGGKHYHHKSCIHNLPPADQVAMRGWTVEKWLAIIGPFPEQITPDQWERKPRPGRSKA